MPPCYNQGNASVRPDGKTLNFIVIRAILLGEKRDGIAKAAGQAAESAGYAFITPSSRYRMRNTQLTFHVFAALLLATTAQAAPAVSFAPHEAVYTLKLHENRPNSQVMRADGKLTFTLTDACDGWTTDQKLEIGFVYAMGQQTKLVVTTSSWEAKDGTSYTFSSRTLNNGQQSENFRGKATLTASGGEALYSQPAGKTVKIPAGAIFPNQHSTLIIQAALAGAKVQNQLVFDGTDNKAQSDVSVFLGKPVALDDDKDVPGELRQNPLLQGKATPAHLAFYAVPDASANSKNGNGANDTDETGAGTPDYELKLNLLPNSVARGLMIDYGSFTMRGTIASLKTLDNSACR